MKKYYFLYNAFTMVLLCIGFTLFAEEPDRRNRLESSSPVSTITNDMLEKGSNISSIGDFINMSSYGQSVRGEKSSTQNAQNIDFEYAHMVANNHGPFIGIDYNRTKIIPVNGLATSDRLANLKLGYMIAFPVSSNMSVFGRASLDLGFEKQVYTTYITGEQTSEDRSFNNTGFSVGTGAYYSPFGNNNALIRGLAEFSTRTDKFDTRDITYSGISFNTRLNVSMGCDEYFCKMEDGFVIPETTINRHNKGYVSFDTYNMPYIDFGSIKTKPEMGTESSTSYFSAGLNLAADYYVIDNLAARGGIYMNSYSENSKESDAKSSNSNWSLELGARYHLPVDDWLNNFSGFVNAEAGQLKSSSSYDPNVEATVRLDNIFGLKIGIDYEHPVSEDVSFYGRGGFNRLSYSDTNSSNSYISSGPFVSFGVRLHTDRFRY